MIKNFSILPFLYKNSLKIGIIVKRLGQKGTKVL